MKLLIWLGLISGIFAVGLNAMEMELKIEPAEVEKADNIPGWKIFEYVKDGNVTLEWAGDDRALKLSTEAEKKGMMLIVEKPVSLEHGKGGSISFAFTVAGKGTLVGGAYLLDAEDKRIGGVFGAPQYIKIDDEWSAHIDTRKIPVQSRDKAVAKIVPYLTIRPGSEVLLKSLSYKITMKEE